MKANVQIMVQWHPINIVTEDDFISLTDMLAAKDGDFFISDWLRNRNTVEFLGIWESLYNPDFNYGEFAIIKSQVWLNSYKLSVKEWVEKTHAIGIRAKAWRYGGTYAHKDIAFEFGMWISPQFKLYIIKEFERLKTEESIRLESGWNTKRMLSKMNYRIHTEAIKQNLIDTFDPESYIYANEADMLNMIVYGESAHEWKQKNGHMEWNQRDNGNMEQLIVIANLESINAMLIYQKIDRKERAEILHHEAKRQIWQLLSDPTAKKL
jgi:KilA-N domain